MSAMKEAAVRLAAGHAALGRDADGNPARVRSETILLVDDEAAVRGAIAGVLVDEGYHVLTTGTGAEALEVLAREGRCVDLVLTDVAMPSMSGLMLAARIRQKLPAVAVVFMSGYLGDEHLPSREHFIQKPFTVPMLLGTIRAALDDGAQPAATKLRH